MPPDLSECLPETCPKCGVWVWHRTEPCANCAANDRTRAENEPFAKLSRAVRTHSGDMHQASERPCATCAAVTAALGERFGCDQTRAERAARRAAKEGK